MKHENVSSFMFNIYYMWHFLTKIRAKPVQVRKQILLVMTTSITLVIFLIWVSVFIVHFSN
jgi:hypothetical protein